MSPPLRAYKNTNELASAGPVFAINPGISRFGFTGQHGVDWDLYWLADRPQQAHIGNWAVNWHQEVNPFEERQHILRVQGGGPFTAVILPFRRGAKPAGLQIAQEDDTLRISTDSDRTVIGGQYVTYQSQEKQVLTLFDGGAAEVGGIKARGGPVEVVIEAQKARVTLHGTKGPRSLAIPGARKTQAPAGSGVSLEFKGGVITADYRADTPVTIEVPLSK